MKKLLIVIFLISFISCSDKDNSSEKSNSITTEYDYKYYNGTKKLSLEFSKDLIIEENIKSFKYYTENGKLIYEGEFLKHKESSGQRDMSSQRFFSPSGEVVVEYNPKNNQGDYGPYVFNKNIDTITKQFWDTKVNEFYNKYDVKEQIIKKFSDGKAKELVKFININDSKIVVERIGYELVKRDEPGVVYKKFEEKLLGDYRRYRVYEINYGDWIPILVNDGSLFSDNFPDKSLVYNNRLKNEFYFERKKGDITSSFNYINNNLGFSINTDGSNIEHLIKNGKSVSGYEFGFERRIYWVKENIKPSKFNRFQSITRSGKRGYESYLQKTKGPGNHFDQSDEMRDGTYLEDRYNENPIYKFTKYSETSETFFNGAIENRREVFVLDESISDKQREKILNDYYSNKNLLYKVISSETYFQSYEGISFPSEKNIRSSYSLNEDKPKSNPEFKYFYNSGNKLLDITFNKELNNGTLKYFDNKGKLIAKSTILDLKLPLPMQSFKLQNIVEVNSNKRRYHDFGVEGTIIQYVFESHEGYDRYMTKKHLFPQYFYRSDPIDDKRVDSVWVRKHYDVEIKTDLTKNVLGKSLSRVINYKKPYRDGDKWVKDGFEKVFEDGNEIEVITWKKGVESNDF